MSKHKKKSRSRSRQRNRSRDKQKDRSRQTQRQKDRYREENDSYTSRHKKRDRRESSQSSENREQREFIGQRGQRGEQSPIQPKYKVQETRTLCIESINVSMAQIERVLSDASIAAETSLPDEVEMNSTSAFARYPSIQVASKVYSHLGGQIMINGRSYKISFYPLKKIDLNMSYDWYCDKCDYKNFARRNKCYRCDNEKNSNCKLNYDTQPQAIVHPKQSKQENASNCSIMIRGPIITQTDEEILLEIFQGFAPVKDIRIIKNKMTGKFKDFAFVEFFSPEETSNAMKAASSQDFRVKGQKVTVMYSRNKSDDDYAKPLPYERRDRKKQFPKKDIPKSDNYYNRQRQIEIQQEKERPLITVEQVKEKKEQEMKKNAPIVREMTQQQNKRKQAEMQAKQLERQLKLQNQVMYICPICKRKFKGDQQMKAHETFSQYHKFNMKKYQLIH